MGEKAVPSWLLTLLVFLSMTPLAPVVREVQKSLEDGEISIPEIGEILKVAAVNAAELNPGDPAEEKLAIGMTASIAEYLHSKFPAAPPA